MESLVNQVSERVVDGRVVFQSSKKLRMAEGLGLVREIPMRNPNQEPVSPLKLSNPFGPLGGGWVGPLPQDCEYPSGDDESSGFPTGVPTPVLIAPVQGAVNAARWDSSERLASSLKKLALERSPRSLPLGTDPISSSGSWGKACLFVSGLIISFRPVWLSWKESMVEGVSYSVGALSAFVLLGVGMVSPISYSAYFWAYSGAFLMSSVTAFGWIGSYIRVTMSFWRLWRAARSSFRRVKNAVRERWRCEWDEKINVFGFPVPRITFLGVGVLFSLVIVVLTYSLLSEKKKEKKEGDVEEDEVQPQSGLSEWFADPKRRALLNTSLFVTSLVSFGNLKWFKTWSPFVSLLGWVGQLLPEKEEEVRGGCVLSPNCVGGKAAGALMCRECGVQRAIRQLHNPRFSGPNKFSPAESYGALCEDIMTKANIDWFTSCPIELRTSIVQDEEIRQDIESGQVFVHVDGATGNPFIKSRRDPMTIATLAHHRMFVSAGILRNTLTAAEVRGADLHSNDMGLGFKMESTTLPSNSGSVCSRKRKEPSEEMAPSLTSEEEEKGSSEEVGSFVPLPQGADPDVQLPLSDSYWLFLKNGEWTVWKSLPIKIRGWTNYFKTWKNGHPYMATAIDLMLICVSIFVVYLACTATFEMTKGWLRQRWQSYFGVNLSDVELEGRGMKHRHVAKAEGVGKFKERTVPEEVYRRGKPEQEFDLSNLSLYNPKDKVKNYVFYDIQSIEQQLPLGLVMINHGTKQKMTVTTKEAYERLLSAGWRVFSEALQANRGLKIPLVEFRANKDEYNDLFKLLHWAELSQKQGTQTKLGMSDKLHALYISPVVDKSGEVGHRLAESVRLLRSNFLNNVEPTRRELEAYTEWRTGEVSSGEVLESNIQTIQDLRCANVANGHPCKIKGCPRCAIRRLAQGSESDRMEIVNEALLAPEKRPILLDSCYQMVVRVDGNWIKQGTAFAGPYGFYTARHVLYDESGTLLFPLSEVRLQDRRERRFTLDPLTLCTPRTEQLSPGQRNDFCKFRTSDIEFNKLANSTRVGLRNLVNAKRDVRILRYIPGSPDPCERTGMVERTDRKTGVCEYTCNTMSADSGAPVFDEDGHCVGMHTGHNKSTGRNVFILFYPEGMVSWFVQAEPKNL